MGIVSFQRFFMGKKPSSVNCEHGSCWDLSCKSLRQRSAPRLSPSASFGGVARDETRVGVLNTTL